ncbi:hypothetical protein [Marinifilum sp. D737]|uniref:hypothetical protein n=1 Tax=Marinifilum sp. D737 TaxID=2969628 RepID=UPI0022749BAC|nr:hypothetical protein [Marinifilum sp. D737]MCY1635063.1 hypothetical protein [Marinifilum sp. D737]
MELKDFVKNTLVEITNGIKEAQKATEENGAIINPNFGKAYMRDDISNDNKHIIDFKVAVTTTDESNAGAGIHVASLFKAGGDIKEINSSVSTICFKVPVIFPFGN